MLKTPKDAAPKCYILNGHNPVAEPDVAKWAEFMWGGDLRKVEQTPCAHGKLLVSTVFTGISYEIPPRLFETLVFRGSVVIDNYKSATWAEAEKAHKSAVALYT
jgi:hypothetical protein